MMQETGPLHILCVDDEEYVLAFYTHVLKAKGYHVECCRSGEVAIETLGQQRCDLLLLDIEMTGMSGLAVLDHLRKDEQLSALPILMVSSDDRETSIEAGLSMGADDYLVKPVSAGELLAKVKTALRKRGLGKLTAMGIPYGSLLSGHYEIQDVLGKGGFSTVYLGRDLNETPPRSVAIKIFSREMMADDDAKARFLREAYAHCRLQHRNIVDLLDFGQANGAYYLVMEHLDGMSLEEIVTGNGALDEGTAAVMTVDILQALQHLHEHGLVHRDIKPHNIMITRDGDAKLLDFGLCRNISDETLSSKNDMCGTPFFISPEYICGSENLDIRTDVYSLGITLFYALTLTAPYPDGSPMEMLDHHMKTPPTPIETYRNDISRGFSAILHAMLQKKRDKRPMPADLIDAFHDLAMSHE